MGGSIEMCGECGSEDLCSWCGVCNSCHEECRPDCTCPFCLEEWARYHMVEA